MANESQPTAASAQVVQTTQQSSMTPAEAALQTSQPAPKVELPKKVAAKPVTPPVSQMKKLMLKVDGQEFEEEFDPNDDNYLREQLQMAKVGRKRMQEYSELQKEVLGFVQALKENPRKALSNPNIGVDVKELAARIIEEEIAESKKSPAQLEKEQLQEELRTLKEAQEKEKTEREQAEYQRVLAQSYEQIDIQVDNALSKTDLPKEPYVVKKIAEYMLAGYSANKDITPDDVIPLVREEIMSDIRHLASVLPEEALAEIFGDVVKKLRKTNIAKAKAKQAVGSNRSPDVAQRSKVADKSDAKKKSFKEFFGI